MEKMISNLCSKCRYFLKKMSFFVIFLRGRLFLKGKFRSKNGFFLFYFSNVQHFKNMCLKGFFEIRKIPEVIGV